MSSYLCSCRATLPRPIPSCPSHCGPPSSSHFPPSHYHSCLRCSHCLPDWLQAEGSCRDGHARTGQRHVPLTQLKVSNRQILGSVHPAWIPLLHSAPLLFSPIRSAGHWWAESLSTLLQTKDPLNSWRRLAAGGSGGGRRGGRGVSEGGATDPLLEICGVWGCLLGGIMATKLAV